MGKKHNALSPEACWTCSNENRNSHKQVVPAYFSEVKATKYEGKTN